MFYFALVITSSAILPIYVLPVILSSSSSPPSSSLWSSLSSRLTDGKFYALANELTLAIRKWVNSGTIHLLLRFVLFDKESIALHFPLYSLLFLLFDCCIIKSTLDNCWAPRHLSYALSSYQSVVPGRATPPTPSSFCTYWQSDSVPHDFHGIIIDVGSQSSPW